MLIIFSTTINNSHFYVYRINTFQRTRFRKISETYKFQVIAVKPIYERKEYTEIVRDSKV